MIVTMIVVVVLLMIGIGLPVSSFMTSKQTPNELIIELAKKDLNKQQQTNNGVTK